MNGHMYDAIHNTLTISRAFEKRVKNPNTTEYALYYKFRKDIPDALIIVDGKQKVQRDVSTKEMEAYITRCGDSATRLKEFNRQLVLSKVQKNPIIYMRKWFHENYANYSEAPEYGSDGFVIVKTKTQMNAERQPAAAPDVSEQTLKDAKKQDSDFKQVGISAETKEISFTEAGAA